MSKTFKKVEAIPSKRLYQSIIADYSSELAICELIDNALDVWIKNGKRKKLEINIDINLDQQTIKVYDNAGGIKEVDIHLIIAPGFTSNTASDETIGVFGVGSKRAVVALSQEIKIFSRYHNDKTIIIEYDDNWLQIEDWSLNYYTTDDNINPGSTIIELNKLRTKLDVGFIEFLRKHLSSTYARFISDSNLTIKLSGEELAPFGYDKSWSYPPHYPPQKISFEVPIANSTPMSVEILAGLIAEKEVGDGEYGVYFYCNDRLILKADKSYDFGFSSGLAGQPHPSLNPLRVFVYLKGNPENMPWNSSKSGINFRNTLFQLIRSKVNQFVVYFAKLARKFQADLDNNVYKHNQGKIKETFLSDFLTPIKLYSLPTPISKPNIEKIIVEQNKTVANKKPWTIGLYEGVILADNLYKTNLEKKNRYVLIVLDSMLEIGLKEYFVNVVAKRSNPPLGASNVLNIIQNRQEVIKKIKVFTNKISTGDWNLIDHYYKIRCNLIHLIATADVQDTDIEKHRTVVEKVLTKLFGLRFKLPQ